jgi:D-alanyl-D-alanine carboxypeptidase/D-alanyl-D-alanine-endopeptidase (penicillin-binding protein 4)
MHRIFFILLFSTSILNAFPQECQDFVTDSAFAHASLSFIVVGTDDNDTLIDYNSERSLNPASVMKLITSATALELLGPEHTFSTSIGYAGTISRSGTLRGDIIIKGGGDPAFASKNFPGYYKEFPSGWIENIRKLGIRKIKGRVITDDSYYDYDPVPSKWLWEDLGNYYGAGVYGASVYDNSYEIHFRTDGDGSQPVVSGFEPTECSFDFRNRLTAEGTSDKGYVFAAPYSEKGWLAGSIPENKEDFILKASITDPPMLMARTIDEKLRLQGIKISSKPTTFRLEKYKPAETFAEISTITSPPLDSIIVVLNHESVNLYAEHLLKELGKKFRNKGSTAAGLDVVYEFLSGAGVDISGMFIVDGSGLSPANAINASGLASVLAYMKRNGKYFPEYLNSLPEAGKEGTLKRYFKDPAFESSLRAKSGSMTRVKSYAGYLTARSGKSYVFSMTINNFSCPPARVNQLFEVVLREIILNK